MTLGSAYRKTLPPGGKPTGAEKECGGHLWRCYSTGVMETEWRTDGGRWAVRQNYGLTCWFALVNGRVVESLPSGRAKRFRSREAAMKAAVRE